MEPADFFELADFRAVEEAAGVEDPADSGQELVLERTSAAADVEEGNRSGSGAWAQNGSIRHSGCFHAVVGSARAAPVRGSWVG